MGVCRFRHKNLFYKVNSCKLNKKQDRQLFLKAL